MALSYEITQFAGGSPSFNVPFGYLQKSHVHVYVNGIESLPLTWLSPSLVQLSTSPTVGAYVKVQRATPIAAPIVSFLAGPLSEVDLNNEPLQLLYLCQEATDRATDAIGLAIDGVNFDARGHRITNLGSPTLIHDASDKAYVDTAIAAAVDAAVGKIVTNNLGMRPGFVFFTPPAAALNQNYTGAWTITGPAGEAVSTVGTTTQGLQEAINYAVNNGYPLRCFGRGIKSSIVLNDATTYPPVIQTTTTLTLPDCQIADLDFGDLSIIAAPSVNPVLRVGSTMMCRFQFNGQIIGGGDVVILFKPQNPVPLDGQLGAGPSITASRFVFGSVGAQSGGAAGVSSALIRFDLSTGAIAGAIFDFLECEGKNIYGYAIQVINAGSVGGTTSFEQNEVSAPNIHGFKTVGLQIGGSVVGGNYWGANYRGGIYRLAGMRGGGAAAVGINTFGVHDLFLGGNITNEEGGLLQGIIVSANDGGSGGIGNTFLGFATNGNTGPEFTDGAATSFAIVNGHIWLGNAPFGGAVGAAVTTGAGTTLTAVQMLGQPTRNGVISRSGPGAPWTDTTDTATNLVGSIVGASGILAGSFTTTIINTTAFLMTLNGGAGVSMLGGNTIAAGASATFRGIATGPSNLNLCRM